jgi:hypothetical protein
MPRLAMTLREKLLRRRTTSQREAGRNTPHEEPTSYRLTLELSGGEAVRLNEMLDGCDAACSGDND